ncbi:MAG: hypothetical protein WD971_02330 [Pirellulales bacterium]
MNKFACACRLAIVLLSGAVAAAGPPNEQADTVTIPLDHIWAWSTPGTRAMRTSAKPGTPRPAEAPLLKEIRRVLADRPSQGAAARAGFAVQGNDLEALREAYAVLVDGQEPRKSFQTGDDISIVFFSYQAGVYVHLRKVIIRANTVEVQYQLIPHRSREATEHFAIIPLGKSLTGHVQVEIIQSPLEQTLADDFRVNPLRPELADQLVCKSFSFDVDKQDSN